MSYSRSSRAKGRRCPAHGDSRDEWKVEIALELIDGLNGRKDRYNVTTKLAAGNGIWNLLHWKEEPPGFESNK